VFYVAETNCGASDRVKAMITRHGGICTEFHECCTTQIKPNTELQYDSFYPGDVYGESYIIASIKANKLANLNEHWIASCPIT
jgi:hypothetical protein